MSHIEMNVSKKGVGNIWLNRPEVHNAFDDVLIEQLTKAFQSLAANPDVRVITLKAEGKSFCAGADLNWMSKMIGATQEENLADARKLAFMFKVINEVPQPVIAAVKGSTVAGGMGLVSVCDYVLSEPTTRFGLTEVRLGLVPATIAPYVIRKIGESNARAYFLSGELFGAERALQIGLVHEIVPAEQIKLRFNDVVDGFLKAGPNAAKYAKKLIADIARPDIIEYTAQMIAYLRTSAEGQEGMQAVLSKQHPSWHKVIYEQDHLH